MIVIIMGVSGSGKTTVGRALADSLGWKFYDADDFHSKINIEKMSRGIPLTDSDRLPWLRNMRDQLDRLTGHNCHGILACSALKQSYRDILTSGARDRHIVYLRGSHEQIAERLNHRSGHFMQADLLISQFEILEEPLGGLCIPIDLPCEQQVATIKQQLGLQSPR